MSTLAYYVHLLKDRPRISKFTQAIRAAVRPGDRVVEIGTGVGTFALAAAQAGAGVVQAIELNPLAVALARELGVEASSDGRVLLIEDDALHLRPSSKADVVIFEDFGSFGHAPGLRSLLEHVRTRVAKAGARYLPARVELFLAPARVPHTVARGRHLPFDARGLAMLRKRALNDPSFRTVRPAALLGDGARAGELRLDRAVPARVRHSTSVRCARSGRVTALVGWTRLILPGAAPIDNAPASRERTWSHMVFPLEAPLPVRRGERLHLQVEAAYGPGPRSLLWRWRVVGRAGTREGTSVNALPGDVTFLSRGSPEHVPTALAGRAAAAAVCRALDGEKNVSEIARRMYNSYRYLFASEAAALDAVFEFVRRLQGFKFGDRQHDEAGGR